MRNTCQMHKTQVWMTSLWLWGLICIPFWLRFENVSKNTQIKYIISKPNGFQKHPWQENNMEAVSGSLYLVQLVDRSVSTEGARVCSWPLEGDIWWVQLLGGPLPNQPSVEKSSHTACAWQRRCASAGHINIPPAPHTSHYWTHNPPPAVPENERFTQDRVEESFCTALKYNLH